MIAPYWTSKDGRHVLYNADCMDVLPTLDGVDAVVTDPPYGVAGAVSGRRRQDNLRVATAYNLDGWQDDDEHIESVVIPAIRICAQIAKRVAVTPGFKQLWKYPKPAHIGNLYYGAQSATTAWGMAYWQPILFYGRDPHPMTPDTIKGRPNGAGYDNGHPCPKELSSWQLLVERATAQADAVLDPFTGSGTTGVACIRTGRRFIGIEISREYCDIAVKRMERELSQPKLPGMEPERITQMSLLEAV